MKKMLVSHECPLDLLEDSVHFNNYEYSLLHLMYIDEYRDFYKKQAMKRYQILDNSAFEYQFLDEAFNLDYFIEVINEVKPSSIIIPDVIGDYEATIKAFKDFPFDKLSYSPEIIGVTQGKTYEELIQCGMFMHSNADKTAVVFHSPAYQAEGLSKDLNNIIGRVKVVKELQNINPEHRLHLLGCSLPIEFKMQAADTLDTANPIQFGLLGQRYPDWMDVQKKPNYLMSAENIMKPTQNREIIKYNIDRFKELV